VNPDHERVEELIAGYALLALSGEDAAEADRLLTEHVPTCITCRHSLSDFQALAGDLALGADPVPPPDLVLARIRRGIEDVPIGRRRPRRGSWLAIAASVMALAAMGGLSFVMAGRASDAEDARTLAIELLSLMRSPDVDPVSLDPEGDAPSQSSFVGVSAPDLRRFYVVADGCPEPRPGYEYQLWLGADGSFTRVGPTFAPSGGNVLIRLTVDVTRYDEVWITEEVSGTAPASPSTRGRSWRAELV
jgi:hypothetical protein